MPEYDKWIANKWVNPNVEGGSSMGNTGRRLHRAWNNGAGGRLEGAFLKRNGQDT